MKRRRKRRRGEEEEGTNCFLVRKGGPLRLFPGPFYSCSVCLKDPGQLVLLVVEATTIARVGMISLGGSCTVFHEAVAMGSVKWSSLGQQLLLSLCLSWM